MVTRDLYKYGRNPAFFGFDLLYIGTMLALPSIIVVVAALATMVLLHMQIKQEKAYLPHVFGEDYLAYEKDTPRYFLFL